MVKALVVLVGQHEFGPETYSGRRESMPGNCPLTLLYMYVSVPSTNNKYRLKIPISKCR